MGQQKQCRKKCRHSNKIKNQIANFFHLQIVEEFPNLISYRMTIAFHIVPSLSIYTISQIKIESKDILYSIL